MVLLGRENADESGLMKWGTDALATKCPKTVRSYEIGDKKVESGSRRTTRMCGPKLTDSLYIIHVKNKDRRL